MSSLVVDEDEVVVEDGVRAPAASAPKGAIIPEALAQVEGFADEFSAILSRQIDERA